MRRPAHPLRLRHRVGAAIADEALWSAGDRLAVAVSGGLDSVCLLDLLVATRRWHGAHLQVVTVDHGIHEESGAAVAHVQRLAEGYGLDCAVFTLSLGPDTSEEEARRARYAAFERLAVDRVALAHHRDDQAETLLIHLLRGTGTRGLAAMQARRGRYVRPLLDVRRAELEAWARHRELTWCDDPTNADPRYLRNRVRRELVPLLEALRPGAVEALAATAARCREDDALLEAWTPAAEGGWDREWVATGPTPLVRRALARELPVLQAHVRPIVEAARRGRGRVQLPDGWGVEVDGERVVARPPVAEEDNPKG